MWEERQTLGLVQFLVGWGSVLATSAVLVGQRGWQDPALLGGCCDSSQGTFTGTFHIPLSHTFQAPSRAVPRAPCLLLWGSNSPALAEPKAELGWGKTQAGSPGCLLQSFPAKTHPGTVIGTRDSTGTERDFLLIKREGGKSSVPVQTSQCLLLPKVCPVRCGLFGAQGLPPLILGLQRD